MSLLVNVVARVTYKSHQTTLSLPAAVQLTLTSNRAASSPISPSDGGGISEHLSVQFIFSDSYFLFIFLSASFYIVRFFFKLLTNIVHYLIFFIFELLLLDLIPFLHGSKSRLHPISDWLVGLSSVFKVKAARVLGPEK